MKWQIEYLKEALNDLKKLDNSQRLQVFKAVENHIMHIIIISMREDNEAYKQASDRVHEPPEPYK